MLHLLLLREAAAASVNVSCSANATSINRQDQDEHAVSHISAIVACSIGLILNVLVIVAILRNRSTLLTTSSSTSIASKGTTSPLTPTVTKVDTSVMDQTIFALLTICSLNSILIIAASIFNISNVITSFKGGPEAHPRVRFSDTEISIRYTLTFGGYLLATALFCTNTVLAFERHWVIRYSRSLSYRAIMIIVAIGALFFSFLVSAFVIASANSITGSGFNFHFGRPFAMPGNRSNTRIMVLFMLGMSYFPLSILVIIGVYMNSYRLISTVVDETYDMHRIDCDNESQLDTVNSSSSKAKRRVLVRCALMGLGCLAFYFPTLFCIFWDRLSNMESSGAADTKRAVANNCTQSSSRSVAASPSWMYPTTTVLPALDVLWTPILILWVQAQHRLAFIKLGKDMRRAVFGY